MLPKSTAHCCIYVYTMYMCHIYMDKAIWNPHPWEQTFRKLLVPNPAAAPYAWQTPNTVG